MKMSVFCTKIALLECFVLTSHTFYFVIKAFPMSSTFVQCPVCQSASLEDWLCLCYSAFYFRKPFHCILRISGLLEFNRAGVEQSAVPDQGLLAEPNQGLL
jgi:hypothetical protein